MKRKSECIILAAGYSSRMGKNKMLLKIDGISVIERCMNAFYDSCSRIIVVTGKYHKEIEQQLHVYSKVYMTLNENYQQGMFSSVKAGVKHVKAERFFITPGDYPLLNSNTIRRMLEENNDYIVPVCKEKQGHPVLLDKRFVPIIINSTAESLRDCLQKYSDEKKKLYVDDIGIIKDMNTKQEYKDIITIV